MRQLGAGALCGEHPFDASLGIVALLSQAAISEISLLGSVTPRAIPA
jgi:hypothetical protein